MNVANNYNTCVYLAWYTVHKPSLDVISNDYA